MTTAYFQDLIESIETLSLEDQDYSSTQESGVRRQEEEADYV